MVASETLSQRIMLKRNTNARIQGQRANAYYRSVSCCFVFILLMYVIFLCFVENNLIIACGIQIKDISLYQQLKTTTL